MRPWLPVHTDSASRAFLQAGKSLTGREVLPRACPDCDSQIRFFYSQNDAASEFGRTTLWLWCAQCRLYMHVTGAQIPEWYSPIKLLSGHESAAEMLSLLEKCWQENQLPKLPHSP